MHQKEVRQRRNLKDKKHAEMTEKNKEDGELRWTETMLLQGKKRKTQGNHREVFTYS